jgi:hypothetical protein
LLAVGEFLALAEIDEVRFVARREVSGVIAVGVERKLTQRKVLGLL